MTKYGARLFPQHQALLKASAISPDVATERGYVSVDTKTRLERAGFSPGQRIVPGMLIPIYGVDGTLRLHQYRPDSPRLAADGRERRYETATGAVLAIDVPLRIRDRLADPTADLWITEGARKADAAVTAGLACVALLGVWGWRGSNGQGGKTALADWHEIALNDRELYVCFDSDVMVKDTVARALKALTGFLASKKATVRLVFLPHGESGAKTGLDDYLAAGHTIDDLYGLARDPRQKPPAVEASPKPPPFAGDLAALLDRISGWVRRYLAVPSEHHITVIALWSAHTWVSEMFYVTPRLIINSAEPESGKTRTLELLNLIARAPIFTMNTTIAALYRRLAGEPRTILLDETDAVFAKGAAANHEDLRALLDAGYKRGATVDRCLGEGAGMEVKEFPAFAPAALAGIVGNMPDTITTRAVTLTMRRRAPDEDIAEFIEEDVLAEAAPLREQLEAWAAAESGSLRGARPVMPGGVRDRKAEVWRALLAVADVAGGRWADTAREACRHFVVSAKADDPSIGVRLLTDLLTVFRDPVTGEVAAAMSTEAILAELHDMDEAPWGDWYGKPLTARKLAGMLKRYQTGDGQPIASKTVRIGETITKGYKREDLWDAWIRYSVLSVTSVTSVTPLASPVTDVTDVTDAEGIAPDDSPPQWNWS